MLAASYSSVCNSFSKRLGSSQLIQMFISYSKTKTLTKTSITSLATRGPSSWDTGQANHYCPEGLQGEAEEGLGLP